MAVADMEPVLNGYGSRFWAKFAAMTDDELWAERERYSRRLEAAKALGHHFNGGVTGRDAREAIRRCEALLEMIDQQLEFRD